MRRSRVLLCLCWLGTMASLPLGADSPLAGLDSLYPWPEEAANLVKNSSFESADANVKPLDWSMIVSPYFYRDDSLYSSGLFSLRLLNTTLSTYTPNASQRLTLADGWYTVRARGRASKAGTNISTAGGRLRIDPGGEAPLLRGTTTGWTTVERRDIAIRAADAPTLRIEAYRKPNGSIWFDQVEVHRQKPPAVEAFLVYPNYRGALFDDRSQAVKVQVQARPQEVGLSPSDFKVRLSLQTAAGVLVSRFEGAAPLSPVVWTLSATAAPKGPLVLRIQGVRTSTGALVFEHPSYRLVKMAGAERALLGHWVDSDNVAVLNGRRRFVLGIYDTTGSSTDPGFWEPRISKLAEAPLDLYLNYWQSRVSDDVIRALASTLQRYDMAYLHAINTWFSDAWGFSTLPTCEAKSASTLGEAGYAACRASALGDEPGLAGWYTADERSASRVPRIFGQYRALRQNDPGSFAFVALNRSRELPRWRDAVDVLGVDPYPIYNIPEGSLSPLEQVSALVLAARTAVSSARPVWPVIQYFKHGSNGHFPTEDELRSMSYLAIVSGAKGLFYWSYGAVGLSSVSDPVLREQYWQRLVRVTTEIRALEPALLSPHAPTILASASASADVRWLLRRVGMERYIIAVNNTSAAGVTATFNLAASATRISVVGESRTLPAGSRIADSFGPYEAHVYRIE